MNHLKSMIILGIAAGLNAGCGDTVVDPDDVVNRDFRWEGVLAPTDQLEIRGVNGGIRALGTTGNLAIVRATIYGSDALASEVKVEVVRHAQGVTICARYPDRNGQLIPCLPNGNSQANMEPRNVRVEFTVDVPDGVAFTGATVNGDVITDVTGDVLASSVNGNIDITTVGIAEATTVNGSITASFAATEWGRALQFATVNGSIHLEIPPDANASVEGSTVNGRITTDLPLTISDLGGTSWIRGSLGSGRWHLQLSIVNGDLELRKSR